MRSTSLFSLFGFALCVSAAVVACGGDDDSAAPATKTGGIGESCTRSADCSGSNVCIDNTCQKKGTLPNGNAGDTGTGGSTGGTKATGGTGGTLTGGTGGKAGSTGVGGSAGTVTTPVPVLGGEGESCSKRADCAAGLGCFNQRCASDPATGVGGEGGGMNNPPPGPLLGEQGETCVLPSDCSPGLTCLPGLNTGNLGVCTPSNSGVSVTGMSCGAECQEAADCCQLPLSISEDVGNTNAFRTCADLDDVLANTDCTDPGAFAKECFIQATYCNCKATTWKCTTGQCVYNVACAADGLTTDGCPTYTRGEHALYSVCNDDVCASTPPDPTCTKDTDCDTLAVFDAADTGGADTCSPGECTCYKAYGQCYRKCTADLDCAANQLCNTKTHVCVDGPECSDDINCQVSHHDARQICVAGKCNVGCNNDLECNNGSITTGFSMVCDTDHVCKPIGCTQNADCAVAFGATTQMVQLYCTPDAPAGTVEVVHSAITDGKL